MHIIKHLFGGIRPYLSIAGMTKQTDTYDDIPFQSQSFLLGKKFILESCASAKSDNFVYANHIPKSEFRNKLLVFF
jgi:hypothetical protein